MCTFGLAQQGFVKKQNRMYRGIIAMTFMTDRNINYYIDTLGLMTIGLRGVVQRDPKE